MSRRLLVTLVIAAAALPVLMAARSRTVRHPSTPAPLSATRSFVITDKAIVDSFTLDRVLAQLIARGGAGGLTPQQMMRQMFDTQNPRPGLADPGGPHCDDHLLGGLPSFNGFPRRCPTPEGTLAATPYLGDEYFTLGIANRFDLAPADGSNCGQYRLIFARKDSDPLTQLHLIFEPVLPNPNPSAGLAGCRPVAQFWADLGSVDSMDERRARMEKFFFAGLDGFPPVIDAAHFAEPGGIRTLQQTIPNPQQAVPNPHNRMYQFRLRKDCNGGDCTLRFVPDVLENFPFGLLFNATIDTGQSRAFRDEFVKHVPTLAIRDVNLFHMRMPRDYLIAESNPIDSSVVFAYDFLFNQVKSTKEGAAFGARIQAELDRIGSTLTPEQILTRATHENCIGCHGFNGAVNFGEGVTLVVGFGGLAMISEDILMDGEAGAKTRYGIDPIIEKQFIPHRLQILSDFLSSGKPPVHSK